MKVLQLLLLATSVGMAAGPWDTTSQAYRLQGDYLGTVGTKDYGIMVAAYPNRYRVSILPGGLPGKGWGSNTNDFVTIDGTQKDSIVSISGSGWTLTIHTGGKSITGTGPGGKADLKKVYRESSTLGLKPPAGAIVLFDGTQATFSAQWRDGRMDGEYLAQGCWTKHVFKDHTTHLELCEPFEYDRDCIGRGNSGIMMNNSAYEIQVLDSYSWMSQRPDCGDVPREWGGSFYALKAPDINMNYPPCRWQTIDVMLTGATATKKARATVWMNGVMIHNNYELPGPTGFMGGEPLEGGPLNLQEHGSSLRFRNIWTVPNKQIPIPTVAVAPARTIRPALSTTPLTATARFSIDGRRIPAGMTRGLGTPRIIIVHGKTAVKGSSLGVSGQ